MNHNVRSPLLYILLIAALMILAASRVSAQDVTSWDLSRYMADSESGLITLRVDPSTQDSAYVFFSRRSQSLELAFILVKSGPSCSILERTITSGRSAVKPRRITCKRYRQVDTQFKAAIRKATEYEGVI